MPIASQALHDTDGLTGKQRVFSVAGAVSENPPVRHAGGCLHYGYLLLTPSEPALMIVNLTSTTLYPADGSDFSSFTGTVLATSAAAEWNTDDQAIVLGDSGFYRVVVQNNVVPIDGFYYTYGKYGTYIDAAIMPRTRYNSTWANSSLPDPALDWHDEFIVNALTPAQAISVAVYYSGDIYYHGVYLNALVTVEKLP